MWGKKEHYSSSQLAPPRLLHLAYVVIIFKISHLDILKNFAAFSPMRLQFGHRWFEKSNIKALIAKTSFKG